LELFAFTYTKFNGYREEVKTGGLGNSISALDTREVDVAGLDDALLGEAVRG
jgi:hypothetical protein